MTNDVQTDKEKQVPTKSGPSVPQTSTITVPQFTFSMKNISSDLQNKNASLSDVSLDDKSSTLGTKSLFGEKPSAQKTNTKEEKEEGNDETDDVEQEPEVHFEPIVEVKKVETKTLEEDEETLFKSRAKMFRLKDKEWKERGTGEIKILKKKETGKTRVVMRRDQTLKLCANHLITKEMELRPNISSDRSWTYVTLADYSEGETPQAETLAVRFRDSADAQKFKEVFDTAKGVQKDEKDDKNQKEQEKEETSKESDEK